MSQRLAHLDTARFLLVMLVLFGHLIESAGLHFELLRSFYILVYAFHVPALAFLSGMVAPTDFSQRNTRNMLVRAVQPLVVCQALYWLFEVYVSGGQMNWACALTTPYWLLWYLASLLCWRILLVGFAQLRHALFFAVALALVAGGLDMVGYALSSSRTLAFFPFFVAGHLAAQKPGALPSGSLRTRFTALTVFAVAGIAALLLGHSEFDPKVLYHARSYHNMGFDFLRGAAMRVGMMGTSAVMVWALLALVPKRAGWSSTAGRDSLMPYLTHGFVVKGLAAAGAFQWLNGNVPAFGLLVLAALAALGLSMALTLPPLRAVQEALFMPSRYVTLGRKRHAPVALSAQS